MNIGIDYGFGRTNIDPKTGIRYGVISQHTIGSESLGDIETIYADDEGQTECSFCGYESVEGWSMCPECETETESDPHVEPIGLKYGGQDEEYWIIDCLDSDLMVLKSPYYTFAQFCSPCVPGAGNLDNPMDDGVKCYALGHDWFEDGEAPYPLYRVDTGERVEK